MSPRKKKVEDPDKQPLVANAADRQQVRNAKRVERDQEEQDTDDFREVSSTRAGMRLLWRFIQRGSIFTPLRHENHATMAWQEGQREMSLWAFAKWQEANPESYIEEMMRRSKERR